MGCSVLTPPPLGWSWPIASPSRERRGWNQPAASRGEAALKARHEKQWEEPKRTRRH